jgi:hypothetical protein
MNKVTKEVLGNPVVVEVDAARGMDSPHRQANQQADRLSQ